MKQEISNKELPLLEAFFKAVAEDNMLDVINYNKQGYNINIDHPRQGTSPSHALTMASHLDNKDMVALLLSLDADVNICDAENEMTPLMYASAIGSCDIAELLLQKGAQINAKNNCGRSAIHIAVNKGKLDVVKLLLKYNAEIYPKCEMAVNDTPSSSEGLMVIKRKTSQDSNSGEVFIESNPFLKACWNNNVPIVKELIQYDMNVLSSCNQNGDNALHLVAGSGYLGLTKVLLNYKSLLNERNKVGETPLHVACRCLFTNFHQHVMDVENVAKCTELLIKAGCDVTARDNDGHCALHALLMGSFIMKGPDSRLGRLRFRLVQLILSSARSICISDLPHPDELSSDLTEEHSDILEWLHSFLRTPRSLQHMCRVAIRETVGETRMDRMEELPCTETLVRYLLLI